MFTQRVPFSAFSCLPEARPSLENPAFTRENFLGVGSWRVGLQVPASLSKSWKHFRLAFVSEEALPQRGEQGLFALSASPRRYSIVSWIPEL